jgi:hypothetical protein
MHIYQRIYKKIIIIFDLEKVKESEYLKYTSQGYKDLYIEFSKGSSSSNYGVLLSHYSVVNNDIVSDPGFEIEIDEELETAEAFTYEDLCAHIRIFNFMRAMDNHEIREWRSSLNSFLESWLDELLKGDYKLEL